MLGGRTSAQNTEDAREGHTLVLEIVIPDFYVDAETVANIDEYADGDVLTVALDEWMREEVGVTFVSRPGEKEMSYEFEVHAMNGRIVGARIDRPLVDRAPVSGHARDET